MFNPNTNDKKFLILSIYIENKIPKNIPDIVAKKPIVKPVKKKDLIIELFDNPKVFIIAISFAMVGMWMILPFAGLEMLLLGSALTYCYVKNSQCEIVKIDEKKVSVALINMRSKKVFDCNKYWAQFVLDKPRINGYPHKLLLRSAGREMEIGALLTDDERIKLANMLKRNV